MNVAQQVDGVGQVAAGVPAAALQQKGEVGMARAPIARNASELSLGNADRYAVDGPIVRHSYPFVRRLLAKPYRAGLTQGRKEEVYSLVTNG
jgi:hypothetical protein